MRIRNLFAFLLLSLFTASASAQRTENVILITTDGFRWQDLFRGMDPIIANNKNFHEGDSAGIYKRYWADTEQERRRKLLPFFWDTIAQHGQIYGNRLVGNKVNNANPHWFSYPGYSELLCGYADERINSNNYPPNPHTTLLEFFHQQPGMKGKVGAFGAWEAFNRIINEDRSGIPVVAGYDTCGGNNPTDRELLLNAMLRDGHKPWDSECYDVFTHYAAMEYLKKVQPRVLYIAYGETDEWAHAGKYSSYLNAAQQVDQWIADIWNYVQSHPTYRNKTTLIITTDHGRGDKQKDQWTDHGSDVVGANETWMAILGPDVAAKGEVRVPGQLYQQQFAQTIARIMGMEYKANHPIAPAVEGIRK